MSCETRLNPDGPGFQLVITVNGETRLESFSSVAALLQREHELLRAWRAQGWRGQGQTVLRRRGDQPSR